MRGHDGQAGSNRFGDKSLLMTALRVAGKALPGDYVRTFVYLNLVYKPRLALRRLINTFYRMDHVYAVIEEFKRRYKGPFSILEFGVADGYAFAKKAYATRYLGMEDSIVCHGFDSFEGLPETNDRRDLGSIAAPIGKQDSIAAAMKSFATIWTRGIATAGCIAACSTRR